MSYSTQAAMAKDYALAERVAACAATQGEADPLGWATARQWALSAEPGWDEAYAYALAAGNESPGSDSAVVSDDMILSAVQAYRDDATQKL